MGLDTSHNAWHGAYGSFAVWRREIAQAAGYKLDEFNNYILPWDQFADKNYQGEWDTAPGDDPLVYLLAHSDCDGVIHPQHGIHIAARLEQLLPLLDNQVRHDGWMREKTQQFIDGLRLAAEAGEDIVFR